MTIALTILRAELAATLFVAAVTKAVDRRAWRAFLAVLTEFSRQRWLAYLVLGAEVTVGVLLIVPALPEAASASAFLILMMAFTAAQLRLLAAGSKSHCACFGTLFADSLGVPTVARNMALITLGWGLLAFRGQGSHSSTTVLLISYGSLIGTVAISLFWSARRQPGGLPS
jgi:uncharacterized membrane protein YphA (DoxX/SURF4 family)